jgi:hypothetical protein
MAQQQLVAGQKPETAQNRPRPARHAHQVRDDGRAQHGPRPSARHSRPRPGSTTQRSTFDESGLSALGKQMRQLSRDERKARRRSHRVRRILLGVTAFIVLLAGGAFGYDEGNTDSVGGDDYNQDLSEKRAAAVRDYLAEQKIPMSSMTSKGFGKTQPVATNDTADGRQANRRVELVVSGEVIGTTIGVVAVVPGTLPQQEIHP